MGGVADAVGDVVGGVGDVLFGEEKKAHTERTERLTPEQMRLLQSLSELLNEQVGQGVEPYPGQIAAGASPLQSSLFSLLEQGGPETIEALRSSGLDMVTSQEQYDPGAAREYWQQGFVEPARQGFWEETMPQLREQFARQNALSSGGFNRAVADAASDMETGLGAALANIMYSDREGFLNRQLQERGLGLSTLDRALAEINAMGGAGGTQRAIEQAGLTEGLQKWQTSQPYNNPWLQQLPIALGLSPYQINTYTSGGGGGLLGGMMPGLGYGLGSYLGSSGGASALGSAASYIGSMFSDLRLKRDITPTGAFVLGVPIVNFRWDRNVLPNADDMVYTGVIADELQKTRPDLVGEADGYLTVDYGQLIREAGKWQ